MITLDADWLAEHPLPEIEAETDKNARGRVLIAGGSRTVPGALALTGEAAFRAGAGKVQLATVDPAALPLGIAMPEAAVFGLPANEDGEIAAEAASKLLELLQACDTLVLGPGMGPQSAATPIVQRLLDENERRRTILLDAAAIGGARDCAAAVRTHAGRIVLTPHPGEMVQLMGCDEAEVRDGPEALARSAAERFGTIVLLKRAETWIAAPGEQVLRYEGGGPGLATAGSGDVLAGILGGLLSRGAEPRVAAAWAVWLHGESGRRRAAASGKIGFLARELLGEIPRLFTAD
ncbi:NAD(P)H-hydrate dehydratase [Sphingomonas sp. JC676]|uniref:NAD(P)H-hydrate dehydratase n=1 Tax=Sphingomonas sp. JC676 TaxID=2768065 RepID=UPI001657D21B|nr:NAD(P)H-hydrate dehydratase [Sphingomonas sp. JC676]MBC9033868.1 NAD(P)H-hydrate dehydratase [Sphingomonas sp. JC676]